MANGLVVDIPGAVERGLQFQQAAQLRPLQKQQAQLGLQQQRQALTLGGLQQQAAQQGIESEQQKAKSQNLFNAVARIRSLPDEQKLGAIQQNIAEIQARGGDASESIQAATLAQEGRFGELNQGLDNLFQAGVSTGFLRPERQATQPQGFTLRAGETRFGPSGEVIAGVAPEAAEVATQAEIPQVLTEGLDPELASRGAAAFSAAGGGKDGLKAFQSIVDKGTEQQRRAASPQILKSSFPNASEAESVQLQSAMDAAKTTEAGLKAAGKVREEQRRLVKAKGFQQRAVDLLSGILGNDELGDVLGSIEGAIDIRLQDSESELIADIEEAGNILTSDNLNLMSGVLSESDIKILKNLAGGALTRTRSEDRFRADVEKLRDKLASKLVTTADDQAKLPADLSELSDADLLSF